MSGKFAPADESGRKPYYVEKRSWAGRRSWVSIGWGRTVSDAKYDAWGRLGPYDSIIVCRRATHEDMEKYAR